MIHSPPRLRAIAVIGVLGCAASPLLAGNLLTNPDFDSSLTGWRVLFERPSFWHNADIAGSPTSGSIRLRHSDTGNNGSQAVRAQCVPVIAGTTYQIEGGSRVHVGSPTQVQPVMAANFYATANCGDGRLSGTLIWPSASAGSWDLHVDEVTAPAGSLSLDLALSVWKAAGVTTTGEVLFDGLNVTEAGADVLFVNGFEF